MLLVPLANPIAGVVLLAGSIALQEGAAKVLWNRLLH